MKIGFPVAEDFGLESEIYAHFGSAPHFIIVDTDTRELSLLPNKDQNHTHGSCRPIDKLRGQEVETMVVGGIGNGALRRMIGEGLTIYKAQGLTIADNITCLALDELPLLTTNQTCIGHKDTYGLRNSCQHS